MKKVWVFFLEVFFILANQQASAQWEKLNGLDSCNVDNIVVAGSNIYAVVNDLEVFLSSDKGITWVNKSNGLTGNIRSLAVMETYLFAGTSNGIFRSADNGDNWNSVNAGLSNTDISSLAISGLNLIAGTSGGGAFLSSNLGASWIAINIELVTGHVQSVVTHETRVLIKADRNVFLSTDSGISWKVIFSDSAGNKIIGPVAISGTNISIAYHYAIPNDNGIPISYTILPFIERSVDQGATWKTITTPSITHSILTFGPKVLISGRFYDDSPCYNCGMTVDKTASEGSGNVFLSSDFGSSWIEVSQGLPLDIYDNTFVNCFAYDSSHMFLGTIDGIWRRLFLSKPAVAVLSTPVVNTIRIGLASQDSLSNVQIKVNEDNLSVTQSGDLYFSTYSLSSDGPLIVVTSSIDWLQETTTTEKTYNVMQLSKPKQFLNYTFIGFGRGYLLATSDDFVSPTSGALKLLSYPVSLTVTGDKNEFIVETAYKLSSEYLSDESKIGIYEYQNDHWEYVGGHGSNGKVSATIHGGKIAVFYNPDQTSVPRGFSLSQNYPNPFNPTTTLRYNIATAGKVTMKVYNILGQEVKTLVNAIKQPGYYEVMWDGRSNHGTEVSSGMYFYRMEAGKFTQTKRMLFVK